MKRRYWVALSIIVRVSMVLVCGILLVVGNYMIGTIWFRGTTAQSNVDRAIAQATEADLNSFDSEGYTGLMYAAVYNKPDLAQALIAAGAEVNIQSPVKNQWKYSAMHYAMKNGELTMPIALLYLDNNANLRLRSTDQTGTTPLLLSIYIGDRYKRMDMIKKMIKHGGSVNAQFANGNSLVHYWVENGDGEFVRMMRDTLSSVVDFGIRNNKGETAEQWATTKFYPQIAGILSKVPSPPVKVDGRDAIGLTTLMVWITRGKEDKVNELIKLGADVDAQTEDEYQYTPLMLGVLYQNMAMTKAIAKKADLLKTDARGKIALMHTLRIMPAAERIPFVRELLANKTVEQLNHVDNNRNSMLMHVVIAGDRGLLKYLIDTYKDKIDFSLKNNSLLTAEGLANKLKRFDMAKLLKPLTPAR